MFSDEFGKQEKEEEQKEIPKEQEKIAVEMDKTIKKDESKEKIFKGDMDFSALEDVGEDIPLDPDLDWAGLDGKKDKDDFSYHLDYSSLR